MKYLDSNVFVKGATENPQAKKLFDSISSGIIPAFTSLISWDETIWALKKLSKNYEYAKAQGQKMLFLPNIVFFDLTIDIVQKAQELIDIYNVKPRDAIHAATALLKGFDSIITDDADFDKIADINRVPISKALKNN